MTIETASAIREAAHRGGSRIDGTTKSGRNRVVSIDEVTVKVLTEHRLTQEQEQDHPGEAWMGVPDGFLFTTRLG